MSHMILLHIAGEELIAGEVEELPQPEDTVITVINPHRRDGKEIHYIDARAVKVIWPLSRVSFIEVLGGEEAEQIVSFVRE
ncbi:MAG: hypothetical protein RBS45_00960 [Anaerolineales bacterium]|jgi:hypothetical protein|nr:hypothetical protein [Anaerolineales bacterium]GER78544.1 conserved hypothetical protein [Candidatus Denitrolinea symbiosum]